MSSSSSFFDGSPFLLDAVADRFEVVLRRYQLFAKEVPRCFDRWLATAPSQKRVFASLDSVCTELFPELLSIVSTEFPQRWMLPVACVALKHHVRARIASACLPIVELSECGQALRVVDAPPAPPAVNAAPRPALVVEASLIITDPASPRLLADALRSASRTAALEVRVAELECRSQGLLPPPSAVGNGRRKRRRRSASPSISSSRRRRRREEEDGGGEREAQPHAAERTQDDAATSAPPSSSSSSWASSQQQLETTLVYLHECRAEALDALAALRKVRHRSRRQAEQLDSAHMEISRLKERLTSLQRQKPVSAALLTTSFLLPKRALSLAGFWNLEPNDLLHVTPALIEAVERRGGTVVRREGLQPCFTASERALVVDVAVQAMADHLPHYRRRQPGE